MKKTQLTKAISLLIAAVLTGSVLAGCAAPAASSSGGEAAPAAEAEAAPAAEAEAAPAADAAGGEATEGAAKYPEFLTVDVFDSQANFQGIQSGWFAKIVKDKFNMELNIIAPNVAGGGDTLFQTRSANGDLGDLILTRLDQNYLHDLVKADLIIDMAPYMENAEHLKAFSEQIKAASSLADKEGMWGVPVEISVLPVTEPCEVGDPTNAPSIRWDLYNEVGAPEIATMEDLLPVLKEMQDAAGTSESGKPVYAFSLFKDWDSTHMQNAGALPSLYGYTPMGLVMFNIIDGSCEKYTDPDGQYVRALKFLYDANQMGIVDPESTTQNYDTVSAKFSDGAVLYGFWPWLGKGAYNSVDRMAEGKAFMTIPIDDAKYLCWGNTTGNFGNGMMVGCKAEDPQRMVDFIDWMYSPEGVRASTFLTGGTSGPEGLTWTNENGVPKFTEFGVKAFVTMEQGLQVPEEWGGGTWADGISALNIKPLGIKDFDPETGITYNPQLWDDYLERTATKANLEWSERYDGYLDALTYLQSRDLLSIIPGTSWSTPDYSSDIKTIMEQCQSIVVEYSWRMVFAESEEEFNSLLAEMTEICDGLGYDEVVAVDEANAAARFALFQEARGN